MKQFERTFCPPPLFSAVCAFAIQENMSIGIGTTNEYDFTVLDCMQVAMLWPKCPKEFRLPPSSTIAILYNAWAATQQQIEARRQLTPTATPTYAQGTMGKDWGDIAGG